MTVWSLAKWVVVLLAAAVFLLWGLSVYLSPDHGRVQEPEHCNIIDGCD